MKLLAFDTATEHMAVALCVGERQWLHESAGGPRASAELIPAIEGLLAQAGIGLKDLDALAFGRGPGAFTGLRTACAAAQGLAFGANKPVLALDNLLLLAEDARLSAGALAELHDVDVAVDARMNELYAARYRHVQGRWQVLRGPALLTPAALKALWLQEPPAALAGNGAQVFADALAPLPCPAYPLHSRAGALLACARMAWQDGLAQDAAQALPLYLRDKVAQTTAERLAAKAA